MISYRFSALLLGAALFLPACAYAQVTPSQWQAQIIHSQSSAPSQSDWQDDSLEVRFESSSAGLTYTARFERFERFGLSDEALGLSVERKMADKSFVRFGGNLVPDAHFRPDLDLAVEYGRVQQTGNSEHTGLVLAARLALTKYQALEIITLGPSFEIYPKSGRYWFSGHIGQSWQNGAPLRPSVLVRADHLLCTKARLYVLAAQGFESVGPRTERVEGRSAGLILSFAPTIDLDFAVTYEDRGQGRARSGGTLAVKRRF
jgi:YaiO family outer membrane protein